MVSGSFFRLRPFRSPDNLENEGRPKAANTGLTQPSTLTIQNDWVEVDIEQLIGRADRPAPPRKCT